MAMKIEVALLMEMDSDWHRNIVMGVADFAQAVGKWKFVIPGFCASGEAALPSDWNGNGVIFRNGIASLEAQIAKWNKPAVNVAWLNGSEVDAVNVVSDEDACARVAAQFYIDRQMSNFSYIGFAPWKSYRTTIEETLFSSFEKSGFQFDVFPLDKKFRNSYGIDPQRLRNWLVEIPKPNGVIVWDSEVGRFVTHTCREMGVIVPEEISLLCIEHDPLWSSLADIPLSHLDQDPWRVGYNAAKILHRMMMHHDVPKRTLIPPIGVSQRQSTNFNAVQDPTLRSAMVYINENTHRGISVKEVASALDVSRRTLESKFKESLKNTPGIYIRKIQLQKAATLLRRTSLTLTEIAQQTGFSYTTVLMRSFKREYGVTPMQFRGAGR